MDAGAALKRQCPESPPNMVAIFFTRVSRYCDLPKIAPTCALFATWPGPAQAIGSLALAFRETGFHRAETDGPKSAPGWKKSPRRLNRLRQKPANCGPLASLREIFRFERLRGGPGRRALGLRFQTVTLSNRAKYACRAQKTIRPIVQPFPKYRIEARSG
jgi:hypothetical protein